MVKGSKIAYRDFPTVVNAIPESGLTYDNTPDSYALMDNRFAKSQRAIGESSNLAMLAVTYYLTNIANNINNEQTKQLYDISVILAVLA